MSIDVDDLVAKISAGIYGDDRMTWDTIEIATTALSQLVAEVEHLRGERAAVVAWLEELSASSMHHDPVEELLYAARSIKRGEHRREEEP